MNYTKISVIIPCYNHAQYLPEALQSVLDQTFNNWECIIVNDGSQDDTEKVSKKWIAEDNRFKYLYKENGGLCSARNFGISQARGEYVLPLDADDIISKDYLELAFSEFIKNPGLKLVYCKAEKFGFKTGEWLLPPFSFYNLARENIIFCSALYKKEDWRLLGGYDSNMKYGFEDWEFWIHMLKNGGEVCQLDQICFFYRIREGSMMRSLDKMKMDYVFKYLSLKHADFFINHIGHFMALNNEINALKKSKKLAVNILFETVFKRKLFK